MRRADRPFQIVQFLRGGRLVTAQELADRLEVSTRTVYRDVADLIGSCVPIESEAGVGYVMRAGYDMPPLMFTADEAAALVAGVRLLQAWGGADMARAAAEALVKTDAVLPDAARARVRALPIHTPALGLSVALRALIDAMGQAANDRSRLTLRYADGEGPETARVVGPPGLWFWGKVRTLIARCELRSDFRTFRVDRIIEMTAGDAFRADPACDLRAFYRMVAVREGLVPGPDGVPRRRLLILRHPSVGPRKPRPSRRRPPKRWAPQAWGPLKRSVHAQRGAVMLPRQTERQAAVVGERQPRAVAIVDRKDPCAGAGRGDAVGQLSGADFADIHDLVRRAVGKD
jgi:predicted DNA-binding transcriptional regulator YafY